MRHRLKTLLILIAWLFIFLTGLTYYRMNSQLSSTTGIRTDTASITVQKEEEIVLSPPARYCNAPHHIVARAESLPESVMRDHRLSLESVIVITRHGDRGPLRPVHRFSQISTDPFTMKDGPIANHVRKDKKLKQMFTSLSQHANSVPVSKRILPFDLIPESRGRLGQLTILGSVQHLKLGSELRSAYAKHLNIESLLDDNRLRVVTTEFERTLQSAISLLFGFLYDTNIDPKTIVDFVSSKSRTCPGIHLCINPEYCIDCRKVSRLTSEWERLRDEAKDNDVILTALMSKISQVLTVSDREKNESIAGSSHDASKLGFDKPNYAWDGLMAFVCHEADLPCNEKKECITMDDVSKINEFATSFQLKVMPTDVFQLGSLLKMRGFFAHLVNEFENIAAGKNFSRFTLLSAHDQTLIPLLGALGLYDAKIPPYASRLVFEVYRQDFAGSKDHEYLFRIVYQGEDVTDISEICRTHTTCASLNPLTPLRITDMKRSSNSRNPSSSKAPLTFTLIPIQQLDIYIHKRMMQLAKTDNYAEACS